MDAAKLRTCRCVDCGETITFDYAMQVHHLDFDLYLDGEVVGHRYWERSIVCRRCRLPGGAGQKID